VSTLAGTGRQGYERARRMPAARAELNSPWDLGLRDRELWIAMAGNHQIWSLDLDALTIGPVAGDGTEQRRDGKFESAAFAQPSGLALRDDALYVADSESSSVRALDLERATVATLAGGAPDPRNLFEFGDRDGAGFGRRLQHPLGVCIDARADREHALVYVADTYNHKLKLLDPDSGQLATYAGDGVTGHVDGEAEHARFFEPGGLSIAGDKLFVADTNNHALRVIELEKHEVATLALHGAD
jgi:sugar lactone lactonase YvrE